LINIKEEIVQSSYGVGKKEGQRKRSIRHVWFEKGKDGDGFFSVGREEMRSRYAHPKKEKE